MTEKSRALSALGNDHFWPRFFDPFREFGSMLSNFFSPTADAINKEDCYEIQVELPGVSEKDVEVSIENGVLSLMLPKAEPKKSAGRKIEVKAS